MNWRPRSVLIADPDRSLARILAEQCRAIGCDVQTVYDGPAAMTSFLFGQLDAAFLSINLSDSHGQPLAERVLQEGLRPSLPVWILRRETDPPNLQAAVADQPAVMIAPEGDEEETATRVAECLQVLWGGALEAPAETLALKQ